MTTGNLFCIILIGFSISFCTSFWFGPWLRLWLKSFFFENYTKCTQKAPVGFIACGFYFLYDTFKEVRLVGQYIARLMMIGFSARSADEQEQDNVEIFQPESGRGS